MILWARKSAIGKWKLNEVEEEIFGRDFRDGCMHKWGYKNEGAPTILQKIKHLLYWK